MMPRAGLHFGLDGRLDLAALLVPECEPTLHPTAPVPTADRLSAQSRPPRH